MKRRSVKTLLSQGAAGGAYGSFFMLFVLILSFPHLYNVALVLLLPICLPIGAGIGMAVGAVMCALEKGVERNWRVASRIAVSILVATALFVLLSYDQGFDERTFLYRFVAAIVFALAILLLTSSDVRPWRMIARGAAEPLRQKILFRRGPIRISRTIEELSNSFLAGLPLRVASLFALMISLLITACTLSYFAWNLWSYATLQDLTQRLIISTYFGLAVGVSFATNRKFPVLLAALVNIPWAVWMLPDGPNPESIFQTILVSSFIALWLLFMSGVLFFPVKKSELRVECGHTEIRFGKQQWVTESQ